jgi:glycosyltransferase involved in cell wall biosynthesis
MAPLHRNTFNMAKSDIKSVELGAWGVPCVLPNFITYTRHWKSGENCLTYNNAREFQEAMETLINDHAFRIKLGEAAKKYVAENRVERLHADERFNLYKSFIDNAYTLKSFIPAPALTEQKETVNAA